MKNRKNLSTVVCVLKCMCRLLRQRERRRVLTRGTLPRPRKQKVKEWILRTGGSFRETLTLTLTVKGKHGLKLLRHAKPRGPSHSQPSRRVPASENAVPDANLNDLLSRLKQQGLENEALKAEIEKLKLLSTRPRTREPTKGPKKPSGQLSGEQNAIPQALRPTSTQLNTTNFLGKALFGLKDKDTHSPGDVSSDSDLSSSDDEPHPRSHQRHSRDDHRVQKKRKKSRRMIIKPIPPEPYNGTADTRSFHRFVMEFKEYMEDGRVHERRRVPMVMRFLTDRAYDFYVRRVADNPQLWTLEKLLEELFNDCFPVNFMTLQRKTFNHCRQGNLSVREFIPELNELSSMIGYIDDLTRVNKLWFGLSAEIQRELWRERLKPEVSSFETVAAASETIELSCNAMNNGTFTRNVPPNPKPRNANGPGKHSGSRQVLRLTNPGMPDDVKATQGTLHKRVYPQTRKAVAEAKQPLLERKR